MTEAEKTLEKLESYKKHLMREHKRKMKKINADIAKQKRIIAKSDVC